MDWDDLNEANYSWPSLANAQKFRRQVKKLVISVI
jgi:hypothetical protein